ncbi:MAG: NlpC/P60 family protein [Cellulosilyticum sp.]|nr:NlpC/P60 family protein [Cellulosilyticum sp.]
MQRALINKTVVTIYGQPQYDVLTLENQTSTIQDEGLYGMPVEIIERANPSWVKVRTHYRYEGYIPVEDLYFLTQQEKVAWEAMKTQRRVIIKAYVDVLACPKVQGIRLQTLTRGALVTLLSPAPTKGGWAKVKLNNGVEGYVKEGVFGSYYDTPSSQDETALRKKIVASALSYLGTQYRWGGKSPLGIDCSGLTSMAYLLNGIIIFRDAKIKEGFPVHPIEFEAKKPGDLFYYPGHVAMYIGDERYIHATGHDGSDGVVINSLNPNDLDYREDLPKMMYAVGSIF